MRRFRAACDATPTPRSRKCVRTTSTRRRWRRGWRYDGLELIVQEIVLIQMNDTPIVRTSDIN